MRQLSHFLLIILVGVGVLGPQSLPAVVAQTPATSPQVTFSTGIDFIEVHAIVTDRTGAFVKDLRADEFEIVEDGRVHTPSAFALVDLPIERPFVPERSGEPVEPDVRATARTFDGRIYVFVLDDLHTDVTRSLLVREAAKQFLLRYLGANDLAAVVYTGGRQESGQELTSSHRLLAASVDRFQGRKLPSAGAEKLAIHVRDTTDAALLADTAQPARTTAGIQQAREIRDPHDRERALNAQRTLQTVENVATWLRDVQGRRKALLLFSEGLDYDVYEPFNLAASASAIVAEAQEAVAAAQRANVNVYGIDPRGLGQFGSLVDISASSDYPQLEYGAFRGALRELRLSQESLLSLSQETGGFAIVNAGDVVGGLGRVVLDNSRYYLLGYRSDPAAWSRRFVKIDVRVKREGLTVRARRGFLPPDPGAATKAREADVKSGTSPALRAALSKPVPIGALPFRVFAAPFRASGSNSSVLLAVEIDGTSLRFQEREGRFNENVEVSIVAADERARVQGEDRQEFDMRLQPDTYQRVRGTGVRLLSRLTLPPGRYQIRVGAHETSAGATGTVAYDLEIPDYSRLPFGLSGLVLASPASDRLVTANSDQALNEALGGQPIATRRFTSTDTLTVYAEAYETSRQARAIAFSTTVHDAMDGRKIFESTDRREMGPADRMHGFRTDVPLKGVPPGLYVLGVEATSPRGGSARRDVLFEVTGS